MESMRLSMNTQQRALADQLAPLFGYRTGVAFTFAFMADLVSPQEIERVAQLHPDLRVIESVRALGMGEE